MADLTRQNTAQSTSSESSSLQKKAPNFSRPNFQNTAPPPAKPQVRFGHAQVHTFNAFHNDPVADFPDEPEFSDEDDEPYPDEPRFSIDSRRSQEERRVFKDYTAYEDEPRFSTDSRDREPRFSHESEGPNADTIGAYEEPMRDMPDEARFSTDSDQTYNTASENNSAGSDFAWDGQTGELNSKGASKRFSQQRFPASSSRATRPMAASHHVKGDSMSTIRENDPSDEPLRIPFRVNQIVKRVSVDQRSERISSSTWEDSASHHTVSDQGDGDTGSINQDGGWQSSNYDTSSLTEKEIRKLEKKGINPALYVEMKAAKGGKKRWVGPLLGNTFLG